MAPLLHLTHLQHLSVSEPPEGESQRDERQYIDVLAGPQRGTTPKRRGIE
jgi:hypothetical protein